MNPSYPAVLLTWTQETCLKASRFAAKRHNGQLFPGEDKLPCWFHFTLVAIEVAAALAAETAIPRNGELALACALLHDTIEDTETTYEQVEYPFGKAVADGVAASRRPKKFRKPTVWPTASSASSPNRPKSQWSSLPTALRICRCLVIGPLKNVPALSKKRRSSTMLFTKPAPFSQTVFSKKCNPMKFTLWRKGEENRYVFDFGRKNQCIGGMKIEAAEKAK